MPQNNPFRVSPIRGLAQQWETESAALPDFRDISVPSQEFDSDSLTPPADLVPIFEQSSQRHGVPVNVLMAMGHQESRYRPDAVGVETQYGRAKGLMQYIDDTARGVGIDPFDAAQSIDAAARQYAERIARGYTHEEAIMAHHGGDDRRQWGPKTQRYAQEVMQKAGMIGESLMGQPANGQQVPMQDGLPDYDALQAQLDAEEPGRYVVLRPGDRSSPEQTGYSDGVASNLAALDAATAQEHAERTGQSIDRFAQAVDAGQIPADQVGQYIQSLPEEEQEAVAAGFFERLPQVAKTGWENMTRSLAISQAVLSDDFSDENIDLLADAIQDQIKQAQKDQARQHPSEREIKEAIEEFGKTEGFTETTLGVAKLLGTVFANPKGLAIGITEQVANMLPTLGGGVAGAAAGAGTGAAVGSVIPGAGTGVGAAFGALWGSRAGVFAGTAALEYGFELTEAITDRLEKQGKQPTKENIRQLLSDPAMQEEIKTQARTKGLTHAAIDAAFMGLSGKIGARAVRSKTTRGRVGYGAGALATEGIGEGAAELGSQFVARDEIDKGDVAAETIFGFGTAGAGATISTGTQAIYDRARQRPEPKGPLGRSVRDAEDRAQQAQPVIEPTIETPAGPSVIARTPEGDIAGVVESVGPDGTTRFIDDEGMIYEFGPTDGVEIIEQADVAPETPSREVIDGVEYDVYRDGLGDEVRVPAETAQDADTARPEGYQYRSDGTPFGTEATARRAIQNRRLEGYEPVEVDGGWAIAPVGAQTAPEQAQPVEDVAPQSGADATELSQPEQAIPQTTQSPVDGYEQRKQSRIDRINNASTQDEVDSILEEEYNDSERYMEGGTSDVQHAASSRKLKLSSEINRADYERRYQSGEWLPYNQDNRLYPRMEFAEEAAQELQRNDPDHEYRAVETVLIPQSPSDSTRYQVERRLKIDRDGERTADVEVSDDDIRVFRSDGTPFKTEDTARQAARNRRLTGYEPVQVEGGWALEPVAGIDESPTDSFTEEALNAEDAGAFVLTPQEAIDRPEATSSPWLMADGTIVGTPNDHMGVFSDADETYSDYMRRTGAIRAAIFQDAVERRPFVTLHTYPGQRLTEAQKNTLRALREAAGPDLQVMRGEADGHKNPEYRPAGVDGEFTQADQTTAQGRRDEPVQHGMGGLPVVEVPVADLKLSDDVPQFKQGADARGVVEPLEGEFDRRGLAPLQVWRRLNGDLEVISGRHRLDLAQRTGQETVPVQIHDEADGFTAQQASVLDAELNIRDGQGTVSDYVDFFRSFNYTREEAQEKGLLARVRGKRGYTIAATGSEPLIASLRAGRIADTDAEKIAQAAPNNERLQSVGLDQIINHDASVNNAINTMRAVQSMGTGTEAETMDMFGFDDSAIREAVEMAKVATRKQREISERLSAITGAARRPEVARREGVDVRDPEAIKRRIEELRAERDSWDRWNTDPEKVAEIREELGLTERAAPSPIDETLAARHAELDPRIDALSDDQAERAARHIGISESEINRRGAHEALKQQHPDDIEDALGLVAPQVDPSQDGLFGDPVEQAEPTTRGDAPATVTHSEYTDADGRVHDSLSMTHDGLVYNFTPVSRIRDMDDAELESELGRRAYPEEVADAFRDRVRSARGVEPSDGDVPHFETYDDANDWIERRAKDLGMSRRAFSSTDEYKAIYPQIEALYQDQKAKTAEQRMAALRDAGLAVGDRVQTTVPGMFLDGTDYSGTIVLRGGEPWVKVDGKITVSKKGRLREASTVRWDSRWKKQTATAGAPTDELIYRADGQPYKSRHSATLAARRRPGLFEPVKVEDGWALREVEGSAEEAKTGDDNASELLQMGGNQNNVARAYHQVMVDDNLTSEQTVAIRGFYGGREGRQRLEEIAQEHGDRPLREIGSILVERAGVVEQQQEAQPAPTDAPQDNATTEPNLEAARRLLQEQRDAVTPRSQGIVKRKIRALAKKTPISDERTVLALDMAATRLDMENLEFADAAPEQSPAQTDGFQLAGQTEQEIIEAEEREAQRQREEAERERQAEMRERADRERDDFVLTGSDRPADELAARGQQDIFQQSAQKEQPSDRQTIDGVTVYPGKGRITGKFLAEVNGKVVPSGPWDTVDEAVAAGHAYRDRLAEIQAEKDRERAEKDRIANKLLAGEEITDRELETLGIRLGSSDLRWFIPAAADLFGISSRSVRPHIRDLIRVGYTDMGAKRESVNPRKALAAIAENISSQRLSVSETGSDYVVHNESNGLNYYGVESARGKYDQRQLDLFADLGPLEADPYQNIEVRPGTTQEQKEIGRSALRDFFRWLADRGGRRVPGIGDAARSVSLLGASIYRNFKAGRPHQLIGSRVRNSADLAALAQVYRDPRFETFRAFFMDADGNIVLEQAASTRMPASVTFGDGFLGDLQRSFADSGAERVYILHNHPSGNPEPSNPDIVITRAIADRLGDAFAGHIVIDYNSYSVIDAAGEVQTFHDESLAGVDYTSNPEVPHDLLDRRVASPSDISRIGKQVAQTDNPVVVVTRAGLDSKVGLVSSIPMQFLELAKGSRRDQVRFIAGLRRATREGGVGGKLFVVLPKSADLSQNYQWMHEFAQDVVDSDGNSVIRIYGNVSVDDVAAQTILGPRRGRRKADLRDDSPEYEERNLYVAHNLSADNILAANELGGLAAPSLAIARTDRGFDNFGEVTLLADPSMLDDRSIRTFDADIYSPRQPRAHYDIDERQFYEFAQGLDPDNLGLDKPDINEASGEGGARALLNSDAVRLKFLEEKGRVPRLYNEKVDPAIRRAANLEGAINDSNPDLVRLAEQYYRGQVRRANEADAARGDRYESLFFNEDGTLQQSVLRDFVRRVRDHQRTGGKDISRFRSDLHKRFHNKRLANEYEQWVTDTFNSMVKGRRLYKGFTPSGNRRYVPYTMENVLREMTKKLQAGENWFYGAGSVRSAYANELRTLRDIQARRDQIISEADFETIRDESNNVFTDALDKLRPFYKYDADSWNYMEDAGSAIAEGRRGIREAFNVTPEAQKIIDDLVDYLRNLPTTYFEAKAQRAVQFSEFNTAVVPKGMRRDALQVLRDAGLRIKTYDPKVEGDRARVIADQERLLFSTQDREAQQPSLNVDSLRQVLERSEFGPIIQALIDNGSLKLHNQISDVLPGAPAGAQAFADTRTGVLHLGAQGLDASNAASVLLHEAFHGLVRPFIGTEQWIALQRRLGALYRQAQRSEGRMNEFWREAISRVENARRMGDRMTEAVAIEEFGAYAIENYDTAPRTIKKWVDDLVGAVKAWMIERFGIQLGNVTPAQLRALTAAALRARSQAQVTRGSGSEVGGSAVGGAPLSLGNTINVDGVQRPTTNSEGRPIAGTEEAVRNFWNWFGDSKAVDFVNADTGAPIVSSKEPARAVPKIMYHTTLADFEAFEVGRSTVNSGTFGSWETERHAIFVTPDINSSQAYGTRGGVFADGANVMPLYIKAENPLDLTEGVSEEAFSKLEQAGMSPRYILNTLGHWGMFDDDGGRDVVEMIKAAGYDSVIFNDENPDTGESFESWAVFRPEQIKSATGNQGTFDPENPDIRFDVAPPTNTKAFRDWFRDSKVVDENGEPLVVYHGTASDFSQFDTARLGDNTRAESGELGFFFTAKNFLSDSYAEIAARGGWGGKTQGGNPVVYPVYLSIKNPKQYETASEFYRDADAYKGRLNEWRAELEAQGFDGVIVRDDFEEVIAFRPEQIKSAIGNVGTFDPTNPDIRYSVRASEHFDDLNDKQKEFLDNIGPERLPQRLSDHWNNLKDNLALRVRQAGVDRYAALLRNDEAIYGEDTLDGSIASSSWVLARMSSAAGGALSAMLDGGRIYLDTKEKVIDVRENTTGLRDVFLQLGSPQEVERFMGWIAANRAKRLMDEGRENLFTPEQIEAGIRLATGKTEEGKSRAAMYRKAWREFQQYRDDVLKIAEQTGIISPEQRQTWREEFYVPFYRVLDDDTIGGPSFSSGLTKQQAYKRLKGGRQKLNDLLENTMMNFHHLLQASLKNQAAQQAIDNAIELDIARPVTESTRDKKSSTWVMRNGQKHWYDIDDALTFKAINALSNTYLNNPIMKAGRAFKRLFTNMITVTPQFIIANTLRDTMQAMATSPTSMVPFQTAAQGVMVYGDSYNRARMLASGGAFSFGHVYGQASEEIKRSLRRTMRRGQVLSDTKLIPGTLMKAWRQYEKVVNASENINRAGIWSRNVETRGKLYAAFEARDLVDFSSHGDNIIVRILIDLVPFLNARAQGLDKLYRAGIKSGGRVATGRGTRADQKAFARFAIVTGAMAMLSMMLYLRNYDDEEYRKLEDWQRDTYWFIRFGDNAFFIPKPFEVGAIATLAERSLEQFVDPTVGGRKFGERLWAMLTDTFEFDPRPQAIRPMIEVSQDRDSFTGRPIEGPYMDRLSPSLRTRPSTTRLAEAASRGMEATLGVFGAEDSALSPLQIDHLIRGYLGQVGTSAVATMDVLWRRAMGEELPARRWSEYQPIRRFYRDLGAPAPYTRYMTDFYEALKESDRAYADVQQHKKNMEYERAESVERKKQDELGRRKDLNRTNNRIRKINADMRKIQIDKSMSAEEKRNRLDRLRELRNMLAEDVIKMMEREKIRNDARKDSR